MKYLYYIYQYLIAWPILLVLTIFTAVFTVCTVHWKNAEFVHKVQQFWSRSFFWLMFLPVSIDGTEHIQPGQSYVFVSNHQSMFDVWLIYGWLPVIFKWLMKAELRKDLGLPVIPLSLDGCFEVLPKGKPFVHRHPVHMHIGEPIDLKQYADPNEAIEAVRNAVINGRMAK